MDPISTSNFNLSNLKDDKTTNLTTTTTTSTKSLSKFEQKNFKTLLPQILAASISTSTHVIVGIALAYSAILIPQLQEGHDLSATKEETSWVASVIALVAPFGSILGGYLMDWFGRLNTLKLSVVPGVLGWVLIATAQNFPMLIIGRMFSGLAMTLCRSPAVVYITEIARKDMRGSLLVLGPTFVSLGMVITYLKGWLMNWRLFAWLCNIYLIIPFLMLFFLPESPSWLVSKNRIAEARKSLNWLHKNQPKGENQDSFAEMTLQSLIMEREQKKLESQMGGGGTIREFLKPTGYKPLLIISGVFFFQQFSGIYIFLFYSVTFFDAVGTSVNPYIASVWIGVIRLVMSILNTWILKFFNRRQLMMVSGLGMGVSMLISGLFTRWIKNGTTNLTWVPIIFLLLYMVASMVGLLTIPWTMTAEIFPLKIRSKAHGISNSIVNVIMFLALQNYLNMEKAFGGSAGIQWFFSGISFLAVIYVFVFLPETHKKKLSEIQDYFLHNTIYLKQRQKVILNVRPESGQLINT